MLICARTTQGNSRIKRKIPLNTGFFENIGSFFDMTKK